MHDSTVFLFPRKVGTKQMASLYHSNLVLSDRWDVAGCGAWDTRSREGVAVRGMVYIDYERGANGMCPVPSRVETGGEMPAASTLHEAESDEDGCPYFTGMASNPSAKRSVVGKAPIFEVANDFLQTRNRRGSRSPTRTSLGVSFHRSEIKSFSYAGPSGPLFGKIEEERLTKTPAQNALDETLPPNAIPIPAVDRDSLLSLSAHDVKKALGKRFRKGLCDASGLTKAYFLHVLVGLSKKITGRDKTAGMRCCVLNASGTRLGVVGHYPNECPPAEFDTDTFDPIFRTDGHERGSIPWPDSDDIMRVKRKDYDDADAYERAVYDALTNRSNRSVLLAYLLEPFLLSPIHILTTLVLDDCALRDHDAHVLGLLLRRKPSATYDRLKEAEGLPLEGAPPTPDVDARNHVANVFGSPPLRVLSLRLNFITDIGIMLLKKAVKYHATIEEIRLEGNNLIRPGEGLKIPEANLKPNPKFLLPFFDSDNCGGNEEIIVLRQRLDKNRRRTLQELQKDANRSCLLCF